MTIRPNYFRPKTTLISILGLFACVPLEQTGNIQQAVVECPEGCTCTCEGGTGGTGGSSAGDSGASGSSGSSGSESGGNSGTGGTSGSSSGGGSGGTGGVACNFTGYTVDSWKKLDNQPVANISGYTEHALGIATDPQIPGTLYSTWQVWSGGTVDNAGGLFKSTDCGVTWSEVGSFGALHDVSVNPNNSQELYVNNGVRGTLGMWYTSDGGSSWTQRSITDSSLTSAQNTAIMQNANDIMRVAIDPSNWSHIIVSSHYYGGTPPAAGASGLYESFDKGVTWTGHNPYTQDWGTSNVVAFIDANTWLLGAQGTNGGWWRSTNSGSTWTKVYNTPMSHGGMRLHRDSLDDLWIGTTQYITRSTDEGVNWTAVGTSDSGQYWTAVGGVDGKVIAGRWLGPSLRYLVEGTTPSCFSNCSGGSANTLMSGMTDAGSHAFAHDPVNKMYYVGQLGWGLAAVHYDN